MTHSPHLKNHIIKQADKKIDNIIHHHITDYKFALLILKLQSFYFNFNFLYLFFFSHFSKR